MNAKPCIEHDLKCRGSGYGYLQHEGRQVLAHRLAYCNHLGKRIEEIEGLVVRHSCDNPRCINPQHLKIGTQAENMADKTERGRTLRGAEIENSKLKQHQIDEIKRLYKPRSKTFNQYQLGKMFKVSQGQISMIINGKRWANESGDAA
jgi:predicted XRE-type DNA-binding protein